MPVVCWANSPNRRTSPLWRHGFCDIRAPEVKKKWLKKNTKIKPRNINLVKRADKQKYATTNGKPNILIDDYKKREYYKILKNLNINPKTFALRSTSSSIKDSLRKKTSDAYEKGIFGAPTFVSNNKIFWGQDRIEFVLKEAIK